MTDVRISERPPGDFNSESSAIKAAASAIGLAIPLAEMTNWLLAAKGAVIFSGDYPTTTTAVSSRVYHRPSANCDRILIIAVIEKASQAGGTITVTPDDGGGTAVSYTTDTTAASNQFTDPLWQLWVTTADLVDTSEQYHTVVWTDLIVRSLTIMEMPRGLLDPSTDTAVAFRDGANSGLFAGRMITDGSSASMIDIFTGIASAKTATKRNGGGVMFGDATPWSLTSSGSWGNIADPFVGTSGFYFRHKARQVDSATSEVTYTGRVRAKYKGTGTGQLVLSGAKATLSFLTLSSSYAWYSGTWNVAADATDLIYPLAKTTDGTTAVAVTAIEFYEV
jgi:hypothetical protein